LTIASGSIRQCTIAARERAQGRLGAPTPEVPLDHDADAALEDAHAEPLDQQLGGDPQPFGLDVVLRVAERIEQRLLEVVLR
jgi:hypothetical protein